MPKNPLIRRNFILQTKAAERLYHEYAADMRIIDYHCHLPVAQIAQDHRFADLAEIWLAGDHYKWRAMRTAGIDERYCTGDASPWEKFFKWAEVVPKTLENPLYHWTHMELARPFGIRDRLLGPQTAKGIWDECNAKLAEESFSARNIMRRMDVALVCTTDDPADDLVHHKQIANDSSFAISILPGWRPDKALAVESPEAFATWVNKLEAAADTAITDFASFMDALRGRHDAFHAVGCRLSDHGIATAYGQDYTDAEIARIFEKARAGTAVDDDDIARFKSAMLYELAVMDCEKDWTQQYHIGALRNNNTRMFERIGCDTGFDSMGDLEVAGPLAKMLDRLDRRGKLTRTILYNANPRDSAMMATMIGNFQDGSTPGKMQWGSGWWHLDQKDNMEAQMRTLANMGLLSPFVGMVTDSRSFLSYTRHDYFRRILCNLLGGDMREGLIPRDYDLVGGMVRNICYDNAARYFKFPGLS